MQERYLGDIHDFMKFFFIKFLSLKFNKKIGLNWYLISTDSLGLKEKELKDGERRNFLNNEYFRNLDYKIFNELLRLKKKKNRAISFFEKKSHLKSYIMFFSEKIESQDRNLWFQSSMNYFTESDIIFLDADNGLIVDSIRNKSKKSNKYIKFCELKKLFNAGKTIIFTQFQSYSLKHYLMLEKKLRK